MIDIVDADNEYSNLYLFHCYFLDLLIFFFKFQIEFCMRGISIIFLTLNATPTSAVIMDFCMHVMHTIFRN